ncbi:hypothetical protein FHG87_019159 [Trinorchestia longiramus]|nr:hypothetical protein FHG87_019159 [Trinorchestia longiramus]
MPTVTFLNTCPRVPLFPSSGIEGQGGVPSIRPLETLHNALSFRQLDEFLRRITRFPRSTPLSSPPKTSPRQQFPPHPHHPRLHLGKIAAKTTDGQPSVPSPSSASSMSWWSGPPSFISSGPPSPYTTALLDSPSHSHPLQQQFFGSGSVQPTQAERWIPPACVPLSVVVTCRSLVTSTIPEESVVDTCLIVTEARTKRSFSQPGAGGSFCLSGYDGSSHHSGSSGTVTQLASSDSVSEATLAGRLTQAGGVYAVKPLSEEIKCAASNLPRHSHRAGVNAPTRPVQLLKRKTSSDELSTLKRNLATLPEQERYQKEAYLREWMTQQASSSMTGHEQVPDNTSGRFPGEDLVCAICPLETSRQSLSSYSEASTPCSPCDVEIIDDEEGSESCGSHSHTEMASIIEYPADSATPDVSLSDAQDGDITDPTCSVVASTSVPVSSSVL